MENKQLQKELVGKKIQQVEYPDHEGNFVTLHFTNNSFVTFIPMVYKGELT